MKLRLCPQESAGSGLQTAPCIELVHLEVAPDFEAAWLRALSLRGAGDKQVVASAAAAVRTDLGWPATLFDLTLADAQGREQRLLVVYRFFHFVAAAWASAPSLDPAQREAILAILLTGRPDFGGAEVVALSELWSAGSLS